ncbi:MAG: DNA-processing protein DprA [Candidatus Kapaibacterium sp.]
MSLPGNWTLENILALSYIRGINVNIQRQTIETYESLDHVLDADLPPALAAKLSQGDLFSSPVGPAQAASRQQLELCRREDVDIITIWDDEYPGLMRDIPYPPVVLYIKGRLESPETVSIAMVGTRRCTTYGKLTAERFAKEFVRAGVIVTSGLAYGIDTASHMAAIDAGGTTYAVIASGVDSISPAVSVRNAEKIVESGGAIISEYPCGTKARPGYFPQRNRIISGISMATLVVESAARGGALITANFAFDHQRELFAVPGNINAEKSEGTNKLIHKQMAHIALNPEMVLGELGLTAAQKNGNSQQVISFTNKLDKIIYENLNLEPLHIDELADRTGLDMPEILPRLLNLEFEGLARQLPGKYYIRNK